MALHAVAPWSWAARPGPGHRGGSRAGRPVTGRRGPGPETPASPQKLCWALFSSSRHSEVGVRPSRAVPREELWDHHLSVGGAHGRPHALCGAQPGAGTPASAGSPPPQPLCAEVARPPGVSLYPQADADRLAVCFLCPPSRSSGKHRTLQPSGSSEARGAGQLVGRGSLRLPPPCTAS